jgi:hypothetical protein
MTANIISSAHPADGDILRSHDGECSETERLDIATHIAECPVCTETSRLFQTTTKQLHAALEDIPVPQVPYAKERFLAAAKHSRSRGPFGWMAEQRTPLLRAAVILLSLLVVSMWAPPVRAWFLRLLNVAPAETVEPTEDTQRVTTGDPATSSTVSFVPTAAVFTIDVATAQPTGNLTIYVVESATASARITGRSPGDALLVTEAGIRIQNSSESSAEYAVMVPATVSAVTVQIAGGVLTSYTTQTIIAQDSTVVSLQ